MRKLIESTLASLDGVVEAPERWANFDDEAKALALTELGNFDALVIGRVTFEMLSAYWDDNTGDPYVDAINAAQACGVAIADRDGMERHPPRTRRIQRDRPAERPARKDLIKYGTSRLDETRASGSAENSASTSW